MATLENATRARAPSGRYRPEFAPLAHTFVENSHAEEKPGAAYSVVG
jgi:hypothetical protein